MIDPISAAKSALSCIKDGVGAIIDTNKRVAVNSAVISLQGVVSSQRERIDSLLEEKRRLEEQCDERGKWDGNEKKNHSLQCIAPNAFCYVLSGSRANEDNTAKFCQLCFDKRVKSALQPYASAAGHNVLRCHECGSEILVKPASARSSPAW